MASSDEHTNQMVGGYLPFAPSISMLHFSLCPLRHICVYYTMGLHCSLASCWVGLAHWKQRQDTRKGRTVRSSIHSFPTGNSL